MFDAPLFYARFDAGLGPMLAVSDDKGLVALSFQEGDDPMEPGKAWPERDWQETPKAFARLLRVLRAYAAGKGPLPDWPLGHLGGTPFQRRVWQALKAIPYGEVRSYGDIAKAIGQPQAARAVGGACGKNPVPLFIPCHRVVADGGTKGYGLGGFSCGLDVKRRLMRVEGIALGQSRQGRR